MTAEHAFILTAGIWLGEGEISFTSSSDKLRFYTRWVVEAGDGSEMLGIQQVEITAIGQTMRNHFRFFDLTDTTFGVELKSELIGVAQGTGVIDTSRIAWEFRCPSIGFEGFEVYELDAPQHYRHHAEYAARDHMRTTIDGRIWLKSE